jgi:integrase
MSSVHSRERDAGRSLAMRRKVMVHVKTCIKFAQGRGYVAQNVAMGVTIKNDTRETAKGPLRPGVDFPTMLELNALIDNATGRLRPFIVTAIFTGMRLSELRGLPWRDVDLDAGVIHVRQRAKRLGDNGTAEIEDRQARYSPRADCREHSPVMAAEFPG